MKKTDAYYWWGIAGSMLIVPWGIYFINSVFPEMKLATTSAFSLVGLVIGICVLRGICKK